MRISLGSTHLVLDHDTLVWRAPSLPAAAIAGRLLDLARLLELPPPALVGFVGQRFPLLEHLTIRENALLPVRYHRLMDSSQARHRFHLLAQRLGLPADMGGRLPAACNQELRFRANLLRGLMAGPRLLFLDFEDDHDKARRCLAFFRETLGADRPVALVVLAGPPRGNDWPLSEVTVDDFDHTHPPATEDTSHG